MKRRLTVITKTLYGALIVFLLFVASGLIISYLHLPGGLRAFFVLSGSMAPKIPTGSLIFVRSQSDNNYAVGDIVTFKSVAEKDNPKPQLTTTHRITSIENRDKEGKVYVTKGDANDGNDWQGVVPNLVMGKVVFHLPLLGGLIAYARTKEGIIFLLIIPSTILIFNEIMSIKSEAEKIIKRRHPPDDKTTA